MEKPIYSVSNLGSAYEQFKEDGFDKEKFFYHIRYIENYYYQEAMKDATALLERAKKAGKCAWVSNDDSFSTNFVEKFIKTVNECLGFKEGDTDGN